MRGFDAYTQKIAELLAVAPDLKLELVDSATAEAGEELYFLHYVGRANGPLEIRGLDRVRTRDGIIVENLIRYDPVFI